MNKSELVTKVADRTGMDKGAVESAMEAIADTVIATAAGGDKVNWLGFGIFSVADVPARTGTNPSTREPLHIPASRKMKFAPAAGVKTRLNS